MISKENLNSVREFVIDNGIDKAVSKAKHHLFQTKSDVLFHPLQDAYGSDIINVALKLNRSRWRRKQTLMGRVQGSIESDCAYFVTLTFKNEVFERTTAQTRRRYVSRFLREYCFNYAANIDFGVDPRFTQREHYHAVVVLKAKMDFSGWHKYGAIQAKRIRPTRHSSEAVSRYIVKLTNHAFKVGNGNPPRLIYSRAFKKLMDEFMANPPF